MARLYPSLTVLVLFLGLSGALLPAPGFAHIASDAAKRSVLVAPTHSLFDGSERTHRDTPHRVLPELAARTGQATLVAPTLSTPANNATNLPTGGQTNAVEPGMQWIWNTVTDADDYNLQVALTPSFNQADLFYNAWVSDTTFFNSDFRLWSGTTYYWRVRARNSLLARAGAQQQRHWTLVQRRMAVHD